MGVFFKPDNGYCGDFIPYYNIGNKEFELHYLHDYRGLEGRGEGTCWNCVATRDFVDFEDRGTLIKNGGADDQDLFVYTGCVVDGFDGLRHIFYTGFNYHFADSGKPFQAIMHAVSTDGGKTYTKLQEDTFCAPKGKQLEKNDWRDPFVFYNEDEGCYWMVLCTRKLMGPSRRRGASGYLVSDDLKTWEYKGSLWNSSMCWCPECPDVFRWGDMWYIIYSTYHEVEGMRTYYRMAQDLHGPWLNPGNNSLDGRAFYAGKTASDGKGRYIFGWNPTREGDVDGGTWQWGGNLVVHELVKHEDGTLGCRMPISIMKDFTEPEPLAFKQDVGFCECAGKHIGISAADGFAAAKAVDIPDECIISFKTKFRKGTDGLGIMLRASFDLESGYYLRLEPNRSRFVLDSEARAAAIGDPKSRLCEHADIERYAVIAAEKEHSVELILDGTMITAYLDGSIALTGRMYNGGGKCAALFAFDGEAEFTDVSIRRRIHRV